MPTEAFVSRYNPWQTAIEDSRNFLPQMRTDICLIGAECKIIIDCKYYLNALQSNFGKLSVHSDHLYRMFAYMKNKEVDEGWDKCEGILLYPTVDQPLRLTYDFQKHHLRVMTISLA